MDINNNHHPDHRQNGNAKTCIASASMYMMILPSDPAWLGLNTTWFLFPGRSSGNSKGQRYKKGMWRFHQMWACLGFCSVARLPTIVLTSNGGCNEHNRGQFESTPLFQTEAILGTFRRAQTSSIRVFGFGSFLGWAPGTRVRFSQKAWDAGMLQKGPKTAACDGVPASAGRRFCCICALHYFS